MGVYLKSGMDAGNSTGKVVFWVEASREIGMGHLVESVALAGYLMDHNSPVHFIVNTYLPARDELGRRGITYSEYGPDAVDNVAGLINKLHAGCVLVNHRNVSQESLQRLHKEDLKVAVIDQMGNKPVICDLLINRSVTKEWQQYDFIGKRPECCFGADYAILGDGYSGLHGREKKFNRGNGNSVLVSMGGVDRTGATLRTIEALRMVDNISSEIIFGSGFAHFEELEKIRKIINEHSFSFHQGVDDLGERMSRADIVISAGGNTVYEMACVGAPGIVLWEDEHEYVQARDFEKMGVVRCLGNGIATPIETIRNSVISLLNDAEHRKLMSIRGKELVDSRGISRVGGKLMKLLGHNIILPACNIPG